MAKTHSVPIEPGWYLVLSREVGEVAEWGPRLATDKPLAQVLLALQAFASLDQGDRTALRTLLPRPRTVSCSWAPEWDHRERRCEGLIMLTRRGLATQAELTPLGRAALVVGEALERAVADGPEGPQD